MLAEQRITCPYCWENIDILLDLSVDSQDYIEDCQVCCQPIRIQYVADNGNLTSVSVDQDGG